MLAYAFAHTSTTQNALRDASVASKSAPHPVLLVAGGHVLCLGSGTNIVALMAAQLGARRVTCIEQGPMLYRMAKQTQQSNAHMAWAKHVFLVDGRLQACGIVGMFPFQITTGLSWSLAYLMLNLQTLNPDPTSCCCGPSVLRVHDLKYFLTLFHLLTRSKPNAKKICIRWDILSDCCFFYELLIINGSLLAGSPSHVAAKATYILPIWTLTMGQKSTMYQKGCFLEGAGTVHPCRLYYLLQNTAVVLAVQEAQPQRTSPLLWQTPKQRMMQPRLTCIHPLLQR